MNLEKNESTLKTKYEAYIASETTMIFWPRKIGRLRFWNSKI